MATLQQDSDIRDLLERSFGSDGLLLTENELGGNFFDLSTRLAGNLFQTFTNYGKKLALVVADPGAYSESFQQLVLEHRTHPSIRFFDDNLQAKAWLNQETGEST